MILALVEVVKSSNDDARKKINEFLINNYKIDSYNSFLN